MKPHEETWVVDEEALKEFGDCTATDTEGFAVLSTWSRGDLPNSDTIAEDRLRLATAAPEMARALLEQLRSDGHTLGCDAAHGHPPCSPRCGAIRAALTKAGVLP